MGLGNVRLRLDAQPIGSDRARRIAQVFADKPEREPGAAVLRPKSCGSFKFGAGQMEFARLSQARSERGSGFSKIGRRLKRPSESDDRLPRAVDRLQRRAQSRVRPSDRPKIRPRAQRRARPSRVGPPLRSASPISRQPSTKFGKRTNRSSRTDRAFPSSELDERRHTSGTQALADREPSCWRAPTKFPPAEDLPCARATRAATMSVGA